MPAASKKPANTLASGKPKRPPNSGMWKKGMPSPNPTGRPKDGESWKSVITEVSNMTTEDILAMVGEATALGKMINSLPRAVQVKYMVTARVVAALMFEPTAGLWNGLMNRMEGKVADRVQIDGNLEVDGLDTVLDLVYGKKHEGQDQSG